MIDLFVQQIRGTTRVTLLPVDDYKLLIFIICVAVISVILKHKKN